jgi:hypothetical protein
VLKIKVLLVEWRLLVKVLKFIRKPKKKARSSTNELFLLFLIRMLDNNFGTNIKVLFKELKVPKVLLMRRNEKGIGSNNKKKKRNAKPSNRIVQMLLLFLAELLL